MLPAIPTTGDIFSIPKFSVVEQDVSKFIEELKGLKKNRSRETRCFE